MTIRLKFKPQFDKARTKAELERSIFQNLHKVYSSRGEYYENFYNKKEMRIGVNYEKHKPKWKQVKYKNGKTKSSKKISDAFWTAHVYFFPLDLPINIVQHSRHFTVSQSLK